MDINDIRGLVTITLMLGFLGLSYFLLRGSPEEFQKAAELALQEDDDNG
ncbi:MAG: cbb3-type cytochrome c oxidase subunit 3 [Sinobacterium sp.]|nr:cbb3-type cytochrome c oxidase subunit 3 [Sinobacterium sp.]